jgi:hypothetical protein
MHFSVHHLPYGTVSVFNNIFLSLALALFLRDCLNLVVCDGAVCVSGTGGLALGSRGVLFERTANGHSSSTLSPTDGRVKLERIQRCDNRTVFQNKQHPKLQPQTATNTSATWKELHAGGLKPQRRADQFGSRAEPPCAALQLQPEVASAAHLHTIVQPPQSN